MFICGCKMHCCSCFTKGKKMTCTSSKNSSLFLHEVSIPPIRLHPILKGLFCLLLGNDLLDPFREDSRAAFMASRKIIKTASEELFILLPCVLRSIETSDMKRGSYGYYRFGKLFRVLWEILFSLQCLFACH